MVSLLSRLKRLSPPAAGAILGLILGVIDVVWVVQHTSTSDATGGALPYAGWFTLIWTWIVVCCAAGFVVSWKRLRFLRGAFLALVGPGTFLLSRICTPLKLETHLQNPAVLGLWALAVAIIAIPLGLIDYAQPKRYGRYLAVILISFGILSARAIELRLPRNLSFGQQAYAGTQARNVVLIFLDTVRFDDAIGSNPPAMPQLARFAERSINFESAWSPASWTVPAHRAVLTGVNPWRKGSSPELADRFGSRGYQTAAVFANPLLIPSSGIGAGFDETYVSRRSGPCASAFGDILFRLPLHGGRRFRVCNWFLADDVIARANELVDTATRPYFLALNFIDAHDPYYVSPQCRTAGFSEVPRPERESVVGATPDNPVLPTPASVVRVRAQYRAAIGCMDRLLGAFLEKLERDPNTIIAIVGDHGEQFFEHRLGSHGNSVYSQLVHVPLILRLPDHPPARITDAVSTTDLNMTLLRAANADHGSKPLPLLDPRQRQPAVSFYMVESEDPNQGFSVARGDLHLIRYVSGAEHLYDVRKDPGETQLIAPDSMLEAVAPMRAAITTAAQDQDRAQAFNALGYMQ